VKFEEREAMANGKTAHDLWEAINGMRNDITEIKVKTSETHTLLKAHAEDQSIHTRPPCEFLNTISNRTWALFVTAFGALVVGVLALLG
jgi:hypothetical protein